MTVSYYFRKTKANYSIARVFETVRGGMPSWVLTQSIYCRYATGMSGRIFNMIEALLHQSAINHVTGDVHYLALALRPKRTILTIHDCGALEKLQGWRRVVMRLLWYEWPTRRAAAVTAISELTKAHVMRVTSCPESKISVIPNPIPPGFAPAPKPFPPDAPKFLQIGAQSHKNVKNVALALRGLRCHLTIIGQVPEDLAFLLRANDINYTAKAGLTDAEVLAAYREADAVILCSTFEGFGMPVIEANGMGRPVIASNIEPIRSIAGDAACLVDPNDIESIRAGVMRVISDAEYRDGLISRGFLNAERFAAGKIAARYLELYSEVLSREKTTH